MLESAPLPFARRRRLGFRVDVVAHVVCLLVLGAAIADPATAQSTPVFEVVELQSLSPGGTSQVGGINGQGDAAGTSFGPDASLVADNHALAVVWPAHGNGVPTLLGTVPSRFSFGLAIAPAGVVGGAFNLAADQTPDGVSRNVAAVWSGGVPLVLPQPPSIPGAVQAPDTSVRALQGAGQAVGTADFPVLNSSGRCCRTQTEAVVWSGGSALLLPSLGGVFTTVAGVNGGGTIVGNVATPNFLVRGAVWQVGLLDRLLSPLPGHTRSDARAINDAGQIVGVSGFVRAVRWPAGATEPIALANLPGGVVSDAWDLNDSGWIVGSARDSSFRTRAVLWLDDQTVVDLNAAIDPASGWELRFATGVSDNGWIVGMGRHAGKTTSFLLRPLTRRPVVVVPGIMGSFLFRQQPPAADELLWIDPVQALLSGDDAFLGALALDASGGNVAPIRIGEILTSPLGALDVYGDLLRFLEQSGYQPGTTLFTFPYDWRLDNELQVAKLADLIEQTVLPASGGATVEIIAHSMGGLVVRRLAQLRPDLVGRAIYLGTPNQGAPVAFNGLAFDDALHSHFVDVPAVNRHTLAGLAATFPSVFELLPRFEFIHSLDELRLLTLAESYSPGVLRSDRWVAAAEAFHASLASPAAATELQVVGTGVPTLGFLVTRTDPVTGGQDWIPLSANGDGTVPVGSALGVPGAVQSFFVGGVDHHDLPRDPCVHELLRRILEDDLQSLPPCAAAQPFPLIGSIRWYSASPIRVTVRDGAGRVDGLLGDGSVAEEIPGSSFFVFGGNEGGFLTSGEEYQVELLAYATGQFSLTLAREGESDEVTEFTAVPVAAGTQGSLLLPAEGLPSELLLDVDGDGTADFTLGAGEVAVGDALEILGRLLSGLPMEEGIRQSLLAKVEAAARAVARGSLGAARNVLDALRHEVDAQSGRHLAPEHAQGLRQIVDGIRSRL